MKIILHNTLTRRDEEFVPLAPGVATLYTCGPTVHDHAHIGNFRTFVFYDLLRRTLERAGYRVRHLLNLTDIDDRIIKKAAEAGVSIGEFTARYAEAFHHDRKALRIRDAEAYPRATEHIAEMVALVAELVRRGHAYASDGSVYFRIASFPGYGKLAHVDFASQVSSGRVDADDYDREQVQDFVLWKGTKPGEPSWDSPFGPGRPGWHLECSAMAMKHLGATIDVHSGAVDLIFPHHENEIAQAEGASGQPFARYWVHPEHLRVEGDKMSKRLGNFVTLHDLLAQGVSPRAIRYAFLTTHYRKPMAFSDDTIPQATAALARLDSTLLRLATEVGPATTEGPVRLRALAAVEALDQALGNDINLPEALAALHGLLTDTNTALDRGQFSASDAAAVKSALAAFDSVLDILPEEEQAPAALLDLIRRREEARSARDFGASDRLRGEALALGYTLEDVKGGGTRWRRA